MSDQTRADRRQTPHHHEEALPKIEQIKEKVVTEDKRARRRAAPWLLVSIVGIVIASGLGALQIDTRGVATASTACSKGDMDACRASAGRIGNACSRPAILAAADPTTARAQCRQLARSLEPLDQAP